MKPVVVAAAVLLTAGCGQRGAPLPPFVRIPAAVQSMTAQRLGDDLLLTLVVPAENIDTSKPVDIARIEVYGYTGREVPPPARFLEVATQVAVIPVAPPPDAADRVLAAPPSSAAVADRALGATVGLPVTIVERLSADKLMPGPRVTESFVRGARVPTPLSDVAPVRTRPAAEMPLHRFYMAVAFSTRGRPGPQSPISAFALADVPEPPANLVAGYTETTLTLSWDPSGGLLGFVLDRPLAPEPEPEEDGAQAPQPPGAAQAVRPDGPTRYNVYADVPPAVPASAPSPSGAPARPSPLNASPLAVPVFSENVDFGRERCFTVRAVRGAGETTTEGAPSPRLCVTPVDRFPPAAPSRLTAVPAQGTISLIWEANTEPDLAGYLVLRGVPGDDTLRPITPVPLPDTRFTDTTVQGGMRYMVAVVAVDRTTPSPNVSGESNRVEETRAEP